MKTILDLAATILQKKYIPQRRRNYRKKYCITICIGPRDGSSSLSSYINVGVETACGDTRLLGFTASLYPDGDVWFGVHTCLNLPDRGALHRLKIFLREYPLVEAELIRALSYYLG